MKLEVDWPFTDFNFLRVQSGYLERAMSILKRLILCTAADGVQFSELTSC